MYKLYKTNGILNKLPQKREPGVTKCFCSFEACSPEGGVATAPRPAAEVWTRHKAEARVISMP